MRYITITLFILIVNIKLVPCKGHLLSIPRIVLILKELDLLTIKGYHTFYLPKSLFFV